MKKEILSYTKGLTKMYILIVGLYSLLGNEGNKEIPFHALPLITLHAWQHNMIQKKRAKKL